MQPKRSLEDSPWWGGPPGPRGTPSSRLPEAESGAPRAPKAPAPQARGSVTAPQQLLLRDRRWWGRRKPLPHHFTVAAGSIRRCRRLATPRPPLGGAGESPCPTTAWSLPVPSGITRRLATPRPPLGGAGESPCPTTAWSLPVPSGITRRLATPRPPLAGQAFSLPWQAKAPAPPLHGLFPFHPAFPGGPAEPRPRGSGWSVFFHALPASGQPAAALPLS
jgi:hypothetical protein